VLRLAKRWIAVFAALRSYVFSKHSALREQQLSSFECFHQVSAVFLSPQTEVGEVVKVASEEEIALKRVELRVQRTCGAAASRQPVNAAVRARATPVRTSSAVESLPRRPHTPLTLAP
jgi:hypothetical protein